jgi:hypothetical protein
LKPGNIATLLEIFRTALLGSFKLVFNTPYKRRRLSCHTDKVKRVEVSHGTDPA